MHRIVIAFSLLASLLMPPPARAQSAAPEMHILQSKAVEQPMTKQPDQDFSTMKQKLTAGPEPLAQPKIPAVHMGQHMIDAPQIESPSLPSAIRPWTPAPPETPDAPGALPTAKPAMPGTLQEADFSELRQAGTAIGEQAIDPLRLHLKDGRVILLAGIEIPDYDSYEPGPISLAARDLLKEMAEGERIRLFVTKDASSGRLSRMGDMLAHIEVQKEKKWVQGALLAAGLARVRPARRNTEMAGPMLALEDQARRVKKGLWADPRFAVLTPETAAKGENNWGIVEGTVYSASTNRNIVYLQFGSDWHNDFTVALSSDIRRAFEKVGTDPLSLGGKKIRVRGWLREYNGPYLELENTAWLQILSPAPAEITPSSGNSEKPSSGAKYN
jgi:micrococcal nuclease